jgi:hypothetical protein
MKKLAIMGAVAAAFAVGTSAHAAVNLVKNGSFELDSKSTPHEFGASYIYGDTVTDWTSPSKTAFNVWEPSAFASTHVSASTRFGPVPAAQYLWTLPASPDPDGGAFVVLDGDSSANGPLQQLITGLTVGKAYTLTFDWAAVQYRTRVGDTTDRIQYSLGSDTFSTVTVANPSKKATGWFTVSHTFVANSSSELLSFLSIGTPKGLPPAVVLDGVSLKGSVPEPASWALMILGAFGMGGALRARRRAALAA